MTCREKLKIEHPELVDDDRCGGCYGCPDHYGYAEKPDNSICDPSEEECRACWDREVESYKYHYSRCNDEALDNRSRVGLIEYIKYLRDTIIPNIEKEVGRRDEMLKTTKKELDSTKEALARIRKTASKIDDENDKLHEQIKSLEKDIVVKNIHNDKLEKENGNLFDENHKLRKQLDDLDKKLVVQIDENYELVKDLANVRENLRREIVKRDEAEKKLAEKSYIDTDIAVTKAVANHFFGKKDELPYCHCAVCSKVMRELDSKIETVKMKVMECGTENKNKTIIDPITARNMLAEFERIPNLKQRPVNYSDYAAHIKKKLDSLKEAGFTHNDAMGLLPMWDDTDFDEWCKK